MFHQMNKTLLSLLSLALLISCSMKQAPSLQGPLVVVDPPPPSPPVVVVDPPPPTPPPPPKKAIVLFIGDGMGVDYLKVTSDYVYGAPNKLVIQNLALQKDISTYSLDNAITDSAAAATAYATGVKVNNKVIGMDPADPGVPLENITQIAQTNDFSVGVVTTTRLAHATPAAFTAHNISRNNYAAIANEQWNETKADLMLGGYKNADLDVSSILLDYELVQNKTELMNLDENNFDQYERVAGLFGNGNGHMSYRLNASSDEPRLKEMTDFALKYLESKGKDFFLLVEGGRIDHAGHANHIEKAILETAEFDETVQVFLDWAATTTLDFSFYLTSDHETGGMQITQLNGQGVLPTVSWSTGGHSDQNVNLYADGVNAAEILNVTTNNELFQLLKDGIEAE